MSATKSTLTLTSRRRDRRGFATLLAILLMMLVGTAMTVIGIMFAADARRTRSSGEEAQMRQLLTAGAVVAMHQLQASETPTTQPALALPDELSSTGAKLNVQLKRDGDHADATVRAQVNRRTMEQVVRFERRDGKWTPTSASLGPA